ncbi:uncharacterized protein BT62DRAFT_463410 [Guyanagaster necrorhizus]|uniref:Uncharacterized protein n=1 Tax=Guyanagaster necrorhizus TaxID=856835 RepID=A0A9P8ANR2_9AGAR|nr:uncharacterized protein BT62DRAFT_463410 [Guyanagaster necrorhizus MCA 3950]KAG7442011.1 hypothetical protein BT62DRAFT_463410 [Guyanagaster necrorhizus MCA 3950]
MHTVHNERLWHSRIDTKPSFSLETWQHAGPANPEVHDAPLALFDFCSLLSLIETQISLESRAIFFGP